MKLELDYTHMLADAIGPEHGIGEAELLAMRDRCLRIHQDLMQRHETGMLPFYDLPFDQQLIADVVAQADDLAARFENLVVLGIGGSALGTLALFRALCPLHYNLLDKTQRGGRPRLFVQDNVDPDGFSQTLELLGQEKTVFLVISKSGTTVETSCQFLLAQQWLRQRVKSGWQEHFVLITDPHKGGLRKLVQQQGFPSAEIPEGVGGRFTVFTPVSLLPLAVVGVDIKRLLAGAAEIAPRVLRPSLMDNPAYLNAVLQYLSWQKGKRITVMMPYSDRLRDVADWFRQLWAESLGKKYVLDGKVIHAGPTPVKALGTTDQHSQVQLYMEGPYDKVITFLVLNDFGCSLVMPGLECAPDLAYLEGKSMLDLIRNEQQATALALAKNQRPNCTISLDSVSPEAVGALLFWLEVQTVFSGGLYNLDPLDQPGVEEGKEFTYGLMGRPGFEMKRDEFKQWNEGLNRRFI
jgi:glucose-6-phosphate isomerase